MRKINNIISSSIAPKDTDALWVNPEDRTINIFDNGWVTLDGGNKLSGDNEQDTVEPEPTEETKTTDAIE